MEGQRKKWQPQHSRDDVPSAIILLVGGRGIAELFTYIGCRCVDFFLLPQRHSRLMCANPRERAPSSHGIMVVVPVAGWLPKDQMDRIGSNDCSASTARGQQQGK